MRKLLISLALLLAFGASAQAQDKSWEHTAPMYLLNIDASLKRCGPAWLRHCDEKRRNLLDDKSALLQMGHCGIGLYVLMRGLSQLNTSDVAYELYRKPAWEAAAIQYKALSASQLTSRHAECYQTLGLMATSYMQQDGLLMTPDE